MSEQQGFLRRFRDKTGSSLGVIIAAALLLEGLAVAGQLFARKQLRNELDRRSEVMLRRSELVLDYTLDMAELTMAEHDWDIRSHLDEPDSAFSVVRRLLGHNRQVAGACISFIPGYYAGKADLFEPYASRDGALIRVQDLAAGDHDYTLNPEYQEALSKGVPGWGEAYQYGDDNQADLVTYSYPVRDKDGRIVAVCGLDLDLSWLGDTLNHRQFYPSSYNLVLTPGGKLVAGPSQRHQMQKDVERIVSLINDPATVRDHTGPYQTIDFRDKGKSRDGSIHLLSLSGDPFWQIATVSYTDEVYAPARQMRLYIFLMSLISLLVLGFILSRYIRNAKRLSEAEVRDARLGSELQVARNIQMEMLPKTWPAFPDRTDVDIFGSVEPAREVGGDLFDFFIRDEKLFFCIGDVSGKGVPSAMVMSVTHSLFRTFSSRMSAPARILEALNEVLCRDNNTTMFVTFFLGVLDLPTGRLRYCNAGHDHPVLAGEQTRLLDAKSNMPLGVFPDTRYEAQECLLPPGTTVFLYTDGLTEAKNEQRALFTRERVLKACAGAKDCRSLLEKVGDTVRLFMGQAPQADDLTMLAIRYTPKAEEDTFAESLTLVNDVSQVRDLGAFVKSVAARFSLAPKLTQDLRLAVEEIVVNVMSYAYPEGKEGTVRVDARSDGKVLRFIISDEGMPFDPTEAARPDTTLSAEERSIGGLGIFLARGIMDSINYERTDGKNILTLTKHIP